MSELAGHVEPIDSLEGDSPEGSTVTAPANDNFARVRLADGPLVGPVLSRVVSMMLTRANWPLDRLDDTQLICDALSAHAFAHSSDATVTFSIQADEHEAELRVLDLKDNGASGLIQDAMLPIVGNVLEWIAERVSVEAGACGEGSELVVALRARSPRGP